MIGIAVAGCSDPIEGAWAYHEEPNDLLLEASFVASADSAGEGSVLYDIAHLPKVEMAVGWLLEEDGRYRLDFQCLSVPDRPDLSCDSLSFWLSCALEADRLECDYAGCAECGTYAFDRVAETEGD